jgi:hypothetical protein
MNKFFLLAALLISHFEEIYSQKLALQCTDSIAVNADNFYGFDNLRNYYYSKNNVLYKKTAQNVFQYNNIALNTIASIDFINPLKVLVFYENFNSCVLLDAQFNEVLQKNFSNDLNDVVVSQIGLASNNRFWLFNSLNNSILVHDYTAKTIKIIGQPLPSRITFMQTNFNTIYWIDEKKNLYSSDLFGKTILLCTMPTYDKIQIIDNERVLFSVKNSIYLFNRIKNTTIELDIVENSFKNFYYKDQNLAIFTDQQITNYKIILP